MASAFEGFSLFNLFQNNTVNVAIKLTLLLRLNPILLHLIRQSDQHQFLSRYMTMLDESYIALLDRYPPESLALQLSVMIHTNTFPSQATEEDFQLPPSFVKHDTLWIIQKPLYQIPFRVGFTGAARAFKGHRAALHEFLLDRARSRHYNFQSLAGRMYAKSLLACFNFLDTQLFRYDYCPHCFMDGFQLIPFNMEETEEDPNAVFHNQDTWDTIGNTSDGHQTKNEEWDKYFTYNPEDTDIVDTEKDIQVWSANWHQAFSHKYTDWWRCSARTIRKR